MNNNIALEVVNTDTGETISTTEATLKLFPKKHSFKENFLYQFQGEDMKNYITNNLATVFCKRTQLLFFMLQHLNYENRVTLRQVEIAKALEIDPRNLHKDLKKMELSGLLKIDKGQIFFDTKYFFKGKAKNHQNSQIKTVNMF